MVGRICNEGNSPFQRLPPGSLPAEYRNGIFLVNDIPPVACSQSASLRRFSCSRSVALPAIDIMPLLPSSSSLPVRLQPLLHFFTVSLLSFHVDVSIADIYRIVVLHRHS